MRQQCMETYADTKKRKPDESGKSEVKKRKRNTGSDTINYLREKMDMDKELRERELQIAETREQNIQQMLAQQHQQNQNNQAMFQNMLDFFMNKHKP